MFDRVLAMFDLYRDQILFQISIEERKRSFERRCLISSALIGRRRFGPRVAAMLGRALIRAGERLEAAERTQQRTSKIAGTTVRAEC